MKITRWLLLIIAAVGLAAAPQGPGKKDAPKTADAKVPAAKLVDINHYNEYVGWRQKDGEPIKSHEWPLARAIEKGETSQYEIILIQSFDGTKKTILNSAAPIRNEAGEISGAVDVMQDITQQENPEKIIRKGA